MTVEVELTPARPRVNVVKLPPPSRVALESAANIQIVLNPPYLIKGLVCAGDMSVLYGPPGCGKTFFALNLAHAVATGRGILGRRVRPAAAVLFALEGSTGLAKRVRAIQSEYGEAPALHVHRKSLPLFDSAALVEEMIEAINGCEARFVIVDTLARAMAGAPENSPEGMGHMVAVFDKVRAQTGAHVMVVHHSGKDEGRGARGHNSLLGATDVEIEIVTGGDGTRTARLTKSRDDADGQEHAFRLKPVELGPDSDGDLIVTCVVEEAVVSAPKAPRPKLSAFQAMVLKDALNLLSNSDHTETGVVPREGMPGVTAVRRDLLRRELQINGRIQGKPGEAISRADVGKVRDALSALEEKGVLASTAEWVWRP